VGKESLMHRFSSGTFPAPDARWMLMAIDSIQQRVQLSRYPVRLRAWRLCLTRDFFDCTTSSLRFPSRHGIMFAYNVADQGSFMDARRLMEAERMGAADSEPLLVRMLVACQIDRADRLVDSARGAGWAAEFGDVKYVECSSATGEGVSEAFQWIAEEADRRRVDSERAKRPSRPLCDSDRAPAHSGQCATEQSSELLRPIVDRCVLL